MAKPTGSLAEILEAKSPAPKRNYKKMVKMEIEPIKGPHGGHIVSHHFASPGMTYNQPEQHMFTKQQGPEMMQHIGSKLGVQMSEPDEGD